MDPEDSMMTTTSRYAFGFVAIVALAACSSSKSTSSRTDGSGGGVDGVATTDSRATDAPSKTDGRLPDGPSGAFDAVDVATLAPETGASDGGTIGEVARTALDGPRSSLDGGVDLPQTYPDAGLACGSTGAVCRTAADCCGLACVAGLCAASACLSDGTACTSGGLCCSTQCGANGTCTPLNTTCKTAGNACTTGAECCNGVCNASHQCAAPSAVSYCAQTGDLCRGDSECCAGVCAIAAGAQAGTCATLSTSCQVDGTVCNGCGSCCSHFCGPFGAGGPHICQPASGCHVQGDLCHKDSDCCGGDATSGLPGAGLIKCEPDPVYGSRIGTCGGPKASNCPGGAATCKNACNPEGNVCHYKQTLVCAGNLTNVRNDCCDCISGKECCQPDATGIPRCNALAACVPVGGNCSFSGECCNHEPCLPDPVTGSLRCGSRCVSAGGVCTTNADCCTGMLCNSTPGALGGVCMIPTPPIVSPDAGVPGTQDAGTSTSIDAASVCAYYGQACSVGTPCCGGTSCVNDTFAACTAADTDCVSQLKVVE
jgi:hypothetical protein